MNFADGRHPSECANASIDTSLIIAGAKLNLNRGTINYTLYFGLADRLMWINAGVPLAGLSGKVTARTSTRSVSGFGDSSHQSGALLGGGPALSVSQFENSRLFRPLMSMGELA